MHPKDLVGLVSLVRTFLQAEVDAMVVRDREQPACRIVKIEFSGRGAPSMAKQFTQPR
jgi:hypothetical protein